MINHRIVAVSISFTSIIPFTISSEYDKDTIFSSRKFFIQSKTKDSRQNIRCHNINYQRFMFKHQFFKTRFRNICDVNNYDKWWYCVLASGVKFVKPGIYDEFNSKVK